MNGKLWQGPWARGHCDSFSRYLFKEPNEVPTASAESKSRPVSPDVSTETSSLSSADSATVMDIKGYFSFVFLWLF